MNNARAGINARDRGRQKGRIQYGGVGVQWNVSGGSQVVQAGPDGDRERGKGSLCQAGLSYKSQRAEWRPTQIDGPRH